MQRSHIEPVMKQAISGRCFAQTCLLLATLLTAHIHAVPFVHKSGTQIQAEGGPFYHMGFNAYWMPSNAANGQYGRVDSVLDAAVNLNMKAVRTWAFNNGLPSSPGNYDESQYKGLDYVVAGASKRGLRLVLAIGNFWPAYKGPEIWLAWAEGSASGKTVADFYASQVTIELYKSHISNITQRINTYTGIAYKDEPAIMAWNLLNEPRCPGCDSEDMQARDVFLSTISSHLESEAPNQMTYSSTEGFFSPEDPNVSSNPGAGGQCEGEDWPQEIGYFDVATVHIYYRQLEALKSLNWQKPDFNFYVQYLNHKMKLYTDLAGNSGRPLVIEEFGLTSRHFGEEERKVVFAVVADAVIAAKRAGKPLMGAMFWNAAYGDQPNASGYNVYVTRQPSGATIGLGNPPAVSGTESSTQATSSTTSSSSTASDARSGRKMLHVRQMQARVLQQSGLVTTQSAFTTSSAAAVDIGAVEVQQRKLQSWTEDGGDDQLDGFRRASSRAYCASAAAEYWQMTSIPTTVDVEAYRQMVRGHDIVDILAEAGAILSG